MLRAKETKQGYSYEPDYVTEPGETLQETIEGMGLSQKELAERTGFTAKHINQLISGVKRISPHAALRLEKVTGVPARFWSNLESNYQERKARLKDSRASAKELEWLQSIPTKELIKRGKLRAAAGQAELLQETLAFFRVASVGAWRTGWSRHHIAFRKSGSKSDCSGKIAAWVRLAEIQAEETECGAFEKKKFRNVVDELRRNAEAVPGVFIPAMQAKCAAAGVAVVLVPEFPGGHVIGAAKWLNPSRAMIALNLRGKSLDKFWFTFFHEAGHLLNESKDQMFVDVDYSEDPREEAANRFAREILIPVEYEFELPGLRTEAAVCSFAERIKVHPAIVVGRLQRDGIVPYNRMNRLKVRMDWGNDSPSISAVDLLDNW